MTRKILSLAAATVLLLAACRGGDDTPAVQNVSDKAGAEIANNTTDASSPVDLNSLAISDAGTDETSLPLAVN